MAHYVGFRLESLCPDLVTTKDILGYSGDFSGTSSALLKYLAINSNFTDLEQYVVKFNQAFNKLSLTLGLYNQWDCNTKKFLLDLLELSEFHKARVLHAYGSLRDANLLYDTILPGEEWYSQAQANLGSIYVLEKDWKTAEQHFQNALDHSIDNAFIQRMEKNIRTCHSLASNEIISQNENADWMEITKSGDGINL